VICCHSLSRSLIVSSSVSLYFIITFLCCMSWMYTCCLPARCLFVLGTYCLLWMLVACLFYVPVYLSVMHTCFSCQQCEKYSSRNDVRNGLWHSSFNNAGYLISIPSFAFLCTAGKYHLYHSRSRIGSYCSFECLFYMVYLHLITLNPPVLIIRPGTG
jgi:hypothetical protein